MAPQMLVILQLGYLLINVKEHFMGCLNTKTHRPLYKIYLHRYVLCNMRATYSVPLNAGLVHSTFTYCVFEQCLKICLQLCHDSCTIVLFLITTLA